MKMMLDRRGKTARWAPAFAEFVNMDAKLSFCATADVAHDANTANTAKRRFRFIVKLDSEDAAAFKAIFFFVNLH